MLSRVNQRVCLYLFAAAALLLGGGLLAGDANAGGRADAFSRSAAAEYSASISQRIANNQPLVPEETCPPGTPTRVPTPAFTPALGCSDVPPAGVLTATITDHFLTTDAGFTNNSTSCSYRIGLATYRKFDKDIDNQSLYGYQLAVIPPSSTLTLTATNPMCSFQGDAFYGDIIYSFAGGVRYDERRLDDTEGTSTYEYCTAICSETPIVTDTPTPTETPLVSPTAFPVCGIGADYVMDPPIPENVVPGVTDIGNHCDDCVTAITLPFAFNLYGIPFTTANVSSNGTLQFNTADPSYSNICLPTSNMGYAILPYWDDVRTDDDGFGIYTGVEGSEPNRIFDIEWRTHYYYRNAFATFEARLYEGPNGEFDLAYNSLGSDSATAGVQRAGGISFTRYVCNTVIISNKRIHFRPLSCVEATLTPAVTNTPSVTLTPTITYTPGVVYTPTITSTPALTFTRTSTRTPTRTRTPIITLTPTSTPVRDAYMLLVPGRGAPPNGGTVNLGDRFVLDLTLNAGSRLDTEGQQTCLTFTYDLINNVRVDQIATACVLTNTISPDLSVFDGLQRNDVCNGPGQCIFEGLGVPGGSYTYDTYALNNPQAGGYFRVAQIGLCAVAPGRAVLHWQFSPPALPGRDTEIWGSNGDQMANPALFTNYVINIANQTSTPTYTPTNTNTPTPVRDAYLEFVPESGAPPNGGTVNVGDRFVLDLMLNAGSYPDTYSQGSYLTFTYDLIKNASMGQIVTNCVLSSMVTPDLTTFGGSDQNEVCNGPSTCRFYHRGDVAPGSFSFASSSYRNPPTGGYFRVAQIGLCAVAPGRALLHWQFSPPAPPERGTNISAVSNESVDDPALFTDYVVNIAGSTYTPTPTFTPGSPTATLTGTITTTPTEEAFIQLVPESGAPPNGGTVNVGDRFVLDLMVHAGSSAPPNGVTAQQSYLTYTYDLIKNARVDQIATSCVLTNTVTADQSTFDAPLQNEICNGPGRCTFRGLNVGPGSIAYASGGLSNCYYGCGGVFRVAQVGLCAVAPGRAVMHWQFSPPAPRTRDTEVVSMVARVVKTMGRHFLR